MVMANETHLQIGLRNTFHYENNGFEKQLETMSWNILDPQRVTNFNT